jgi:hypothetical protein
MDPTLSTPSVDPWRVGHGETSHREERHDGRPFILATQYASYVPRLPSSIQSDAQTLVTTAQSAIATNNANLLGTQTVAQDSMAVQLYCGQNQ